MTKTSPIIWIRFLRLPAVLTVPGDVLVGAAVQWEGFPWMEVFAVCSAYLFGMALNDLHDLPSDRQARPERPLPQGNLSHNHAKGACFGLGLLSIFINPVLPQAILLLLIVGYTQMKNRSLMLGALLMAACRCTALWIGGGAVTSLSFLVLLPLWGSLIFLVTWLADFEEGEREGWVYPATILTGIWLCAPFGAFAMGNPRFILFIPWALLAVLAVRNILLIHRRNHVAPQNIGIWLSMLMPLQSIFLISFGRWAEGIVILFLWPFLKWAVRKIQIS